MRTYLASSSNGGSSGFRMGGRPSCAVVGSSDVLRVDPRGAEIDAHKIVIRLNNAPTKGWEAAVGRRTSVRVVNHVPLEKWIKLATNRSALDHTRDGAEYRALLCASDAAPLGCFISRMHAPAIARTMATYHSLYPSHRLDLASDALHRWSLMCNQELRGTSPSGGLLAVLLALSVCDAPISLYGFWPFCCQRRTSSGAAALVPQAGHTKDGLNYKYFQGNQTRFVCCSRGRERMEVEYGFYEALHRRGILRLVAAPSSITGGHPPVPKARSGSGERPGAPRVWSSVPPSRPASRAAGGSNQLVRSDSLPRGIQDPVLGSRR